MDTFDDEPGHEEEEDREPQYPQTHNNNPDNNRQKLGLWQGVTLLTADCLGVGILALPEDIHVLGWVAGLAFLILQLPINYYSGSILAWTAAEVEREHDTNKNALGEPEGSLEMTRRKTTDEGDKRNSSFDAQTEISPKQKTEEEDSDSTYLEGITPEVGYEKDGLVLSRTMQQQNPSSKAAEEPPPTADLIGISVAVFDHHRLDDSISPSSRRSSSSAACKAVLLLYYLNLFLVLGDYILVMSHAVSAMWGDDLCIPTAGLIACTLIVVICQLNTMALLGQYVSMASLTAMMVVLGQCIYASHHVADDDVVMAENKPILDDAPAEEVVHDDGNNSNNHPSLFRKFSALASICFAVGSQKLFLNIRYELKDKEQNAAPVLARSLALFGMVYVAVIVFSGSDPPSFLFDTIPAGTWNRRIAGFLLWCHVAVSYAINSQALCSSLNRLLFRATSKDRCRWLFLTVGVAVSSYLVSNGIPFFKDLVALIGAATLVPLTLTLPPLLYQHWRQWTHIHSMQQQQQQDQQHYIAVAREWSSSAPQVKRTRTWEGCASSSLLMYSIVFLGVGLAGSLASVIQDWHLSGQVPFACTHS